MLAQPLLKRTNWLLSQKPDEIENICMRYPKNKEAIIRFSNTADEDGGDFFPLLSAEDEKEMMAESNLPEELPILPLKNTVLFPGVIIPITVGRQKSVKLVKKAYRKDRIIGVVSQKDNNEEPQTGDLFEVGTVANIVRMIVLPDGSTTIIIQGKRKFKVEEYVQETPYLTAKVSYLKDLPSSQGKRETNATISSLKDLATKAIRLNPEIPPEAQIAIDNIESEGFLTYFLASNLNVEVKDKQQLLELTDLMERANLLMKDMMKEIQLLELKHEIQSKAHTDIEHQQREYFLRQQIKALQDELGSDGPEAEIAEFRKKAKGKKWPEKVAAHFDKELDKLGRTNSAAPEFSVMMNYVELMVDLPWNELTKDNLDLKRAGKILDADHFGLKKIKERILEYLAVIKLKDSLKAPILCFYGPPGVGKTSLAKSIGRALGRETVRIPLGGLHDESEIRGHRKTYIGAMPGKIIQHIKKAGSSNPVFILDEIDKIGNGFRGDPSSALLEVLDPEQNNSFMDNYLEVEYDLSKVLFVATANSLNTIQPALRDRMEIIQLTGYTLEEKVQIAKKHLIPKQRKEHGLKAKDFSVTESALQYLVDRYTRESGVRTLERKIAALIRKAALAIVSEEEYPKVVKQEDVREWLGAEIFDKEMYEAGDTAGVATGLAWTSVGGEILFIEAILSRGKGKITLSGQLGSVMKENEHGGPFVPQSSL